MRQYMTNACGNTLIVSFVRSSTGFAPKTAAALAAAIDSCMKFTTDCSENVHAPIGLWDVTAITEMENVLQSIADKTRFTGDISKWDMSAVTRTDSMFKDCAAFNSDIGKWDVSHVTRMDSMFMGAASFNSNIAEWDVSKLTNMNRMFFGAKAFTQILCGHWLESRATKSLMFSGSFGRIDTCWVREAPSECATKCGI